MQDPLDPVFQLRLLNETIVIEVLELRRSGFVEDNRDVAGMQLERGSRDL